MMTIGRTFTSPPLIGRAGHGKSVGSTRGPFARVMSIVVLWQRRASDRTLLASLDDRLLQDMGLSRADAASESTKPFWRP